MRTGSSATCCVILLGIAIFVACGGGGDGSGVTDPIPGQIITTPTNQASSVTESNILKSESVPEPNPAPEVAVETGVESEPPISKAPTPPPETMRCKSRGSRCLGPLECCSWKCGVFSLKCE